MTIITETDDVLSTCLEISEKQLTKAGIFSNITRSKIANQI